MGIETKWDTHGSVIARLKDTEIEACIIYKTGWEHGIMGCSALVTHIAQVLCILEDSEGNKHEVDTKPIMTAEQYDAVFEIVANIKKEV